MKTYNHNFTSPLNGTTVHEVNGYLTALRGLYSFIEKETGMNPNNRYIDAVKILDAITATTNELQPLMDEYREGLTKVIENFPNKP